jgi:hypothetical protein
MDLTRMTEYGSCPVAHIHIDMKMFKILTEELLIDIDRKTMSCIVGCN